MKRLKIRVGLLLVSFGLWLGKKGVDLTGVTFNTTKIHNVISGPFTQEDLGYEWDGPEGSECFLNVLLEDEGKIDEVEYYFGSLGEAYEMIKYFKVNIKSIEVRGYND